MAAPCVQLPKEDFRIKKLRWFGLDRKFKGSKWSQDITESGFKFHMNNVNASIGIEQMKYIEDIIGNIKIIIDFIKIILQIQNHKDERE